MYEKLMELAEYHPALKFGNVVSEQFGNATTSPSSSSSSSTSGSSIIGTILTLVALYLAFKCKKDGGIDILQLILAICCSPCYIAYRLAVPCN